MKYEICVSTQIASLNVFLNPSVSSRAWEHANTNYKEDRGQRHHYFLISRVHGRGPLITLIIPQKSLLFGRRPNSAINLSPCFSTKQECGKQDATLTNVPVSDPYLSGCKAVLSLMVLTQRGKSAPALPRMLPTMTY